MVDIAKLSVAVAEVRGGTIIGCNSGMPQGLKMVQFPPNRNFGVAKSWSYSQSAWMARRCGVPMPPLFVYNGLNVSVNWSPILSVIVPVPQGAAAFVGVTPSWMNVAPTSP